MTTREKLDTLDTTARIASLMLVCLAAMSAAIAVACGPIVAPPVVSPDPAHIEALGRDCGALWRDELGRDIDAEAQRACVEQLAAGRRTLEDYRTEIRQSAEYAAHQARLEADRRPMARRGLVRLQGRAFADDGGPWLALGATQFWAAWATLHDVSRRDAAFAALRGRVDYIRVLAVVGPRGGWEDRQITAADVRGTEVIAQTTDAAYAAGLRVQWTIFGGVDSTPTPETRRALVQRVIDQIAGRLEKVQLVEIANEGWQNGFGGPEGRAELHALAGLVRQQLPTVPVALTAPDSVDLAPLYAGSQATVATVHTERDIWGTGGVFRPVRQAREYVGQGWPWINNEPIGPQSSVAADDDPDRLALAAIYTWLSNGAAYVYHAGPGIRGGGAADLARGRAASFEALPTFAATVERFAQARAVLPADLPNWRWENSNGRFPAFPFVLPYDSEGTQLLAPEDDVLRAFAALSDDGRFVVVPIRVTQPLALSPKRPMTFTVRDIRALDTVAADVTLHPGQTYTLPATPGALLIGRFL